MNTDTLTQTSPEVTSVEMPPVRVYGLSDLLRNHKGPQATGGFWVKGATCAIAGALEELFDIQDM